MSKASVKFAVTRLPDTASIPGICAQLDALSASRWIDRRKQSINRGIRGEVGRYHSAGHRSLPEPLRNSILSLAPNPGGCDLVEFVVNRYEADDFIPRHADIAYSTYFEVLSLQDSESRLRIWDDSGENVMADVQDKLGQVVQIFEPGLIHDVPEVFQRRHVVIFLYQGNPICRPQPQF
ncbi:hypothetical protein [Candidatus Vondammii sp. HM_W22]|uniref:hypothetical protein n=1 Tax=Candidatus Vondammii sp. HM_W22 TaxID=2687299 RepID=UPI001F12A713|nr:hypothetical protein [Candidatus Vondammii sp. HM_W22]